MAAIVQCHRGLLLMLLPLQEQKCQRVSNHSAKLLSFIFIISKLEWCGNCHYRTEWAVHHQKALICVPLEMAGVEGVHGRRASGIIKKATSSGETMLVAFG